MRVLIVDDNILVARQIAEQFRERFVVECVYDVFTAQQRLSYMEYDVVCLDIDLNDVEEDGVDICRSIRSKYPEVVIIMITGNELSASLTARMLEAGANTFLEKKDGMPFLLDKALSLIEQQRSLQKQEQPSGEIFEKLIIHANEGVVEVDGEKRPMDPTPLAVFQELYNYPNQFIHIDTLVRRCSLSGEMTTSSIKVHIAHIRKALVPYDTHIRNRWGGWYGFFTE